MNRLTSFFEKKGNGAAHSVFYPTNHIVAAFPTRKDALLAKQEMEKLTPSTIAVTGDEMLEFASEQAVNDGVWGAFIREVSRLIGTEEQYIDQDLREARNGAAFVAAYCPDEERKFALWGVLKHANPLTARFYGSGGIEHLIGDT